MHFVKRIIDDDLIITAMVHQPIEIRDIQMLKKYYHNFLSIISQVSNLFLKNDEIFIF